MRWIKQIPRVFFYLFLAWLTFMDTVHGQEVTADFRIRFNDEEIRLFGIRPPSPHSPGFAEAKAALEGLLAGGQWHCLAIKGHSDKVCKLAGSDIAEELLILGLVQPMPMGEAGSDADFLSQHYLSLAREYRGAAPANGVYRSIGLIAVLAIFVLLIGGSLIFLIIRYRRRRHAKLRLAMLLIQLTSFRNMVQEQLMAIEGVQMDEPVPLSRLDMTGGIPPVLLHITEGKKYRKIIEHLSWRDKELRRNWRKLASLLLAREPPPASLLQKELAHFAESAQALADYIEGQLRQA